MQNYPLTPLEDWIERLYRNIGIKEPNQLTITELAARLNIWVYYLEIGSQVIERNGMFSMNIDSRQSPERQWEDFLHELCHVLRHAGNQMQMPAAYTQMQELEANNFQLYAAIPYSMLRKLELPRQQNEIIDLLTQEFKVTPDLARRRLEGIQRRVLQCIVSEETAKVARSKRRKFDPTNWSEETKSIMEKLYHQLQVRGSRKRG